MRLSIICVLTLFLAISARAQSTVSLGITLSDVQSVTLDVDKSTEPVLAAPQESVQHDGALRVLSKSASQIKKIDLKAAEYERLYEQFYSGADPLSRSTNTYSIAAVPVRRTKTSSIKSNLVIYQIDPR